MAHEHAHSNGEGEGTFFLDQLFTILACVYMRDALHPHH